MNTTPTVEEFLAQLTTEADVEHELVEPLESIAESLRTIAASVGGETFTAELVAEEDRANDNATLVHEARAERDDWQAKHESIFGVLATVEKIVSKSTSKVSLEVKAVINAWRTGEVSEDESAEPDGAPSGHITKAEREQMVAEPGPFCTACEHYFADQQLLEQHTCPGPVADPTPDLPGRSPYDA
jgi:hypothetical protein